MTMLTRLVGARSRSRSAPSPATPRCASPAGLPPTAGCCAATSARSGRRSAAGTGSRRASPTASSCVIAPAVETLRALPDEPTIDLAFIDADKPNYANYYEQLVPAMRPNGLILVDNVLWGGRVVDATRYRRRHRGDPRVQRPGRRAIARRRRDAAGRATASACCASTPEGAHSDPVMFCSVGERVPVALALGRQRRVVLLEPEGVVDVVLARGERRELRRHRRCGSDRRCRPRAPSCRRSGTCRPWSRRRGTSSPAGRRR